MNKAGGPYDVIRQYVKISNNPGAAGQGPSCKVFCNRKFWILSVFLSSLLTWGQMMRLPI